jgi:phosphoglucosamine mutase
MKEHNAVFGGEPSGAWIHPDVHMCPDGILSALKILEALETFEMSLKEFVNQAPKYPLGREKFECPNKFKSKAMELISMKYQDYFSKVESTSDIDGIRLELEEGWILIRPSGTEPLIRITVEGRTVKIVKTLMEKSKSLVKKVLENVN